MSWDGQGGGRRAAGGDHKGLSEVKKEPAAADSSFVTVSMGPGDRATETGATEEPRAPVREVVKSESACAFSSHGLKATTLSWVSKAGYSERTQLVLGRRSLGPSKKTQEAYAREVQAQPLRDLVECLNAIHRGVFLPDRARSGMLAPGASVSVWRFSAPPEQAQSVSPEACVGATGEPTPHSEKPVSSPGPPVDDDPSANETQGSGPSEDNFDYESVCEGATTAAKIPSVFMGPDLEVFQNPKTKSLHSRAQGAMGKLTCGRSAQGMKPFHGKVFSRRWKCKQCMSSKPIRDSGAMSAFFANCKTSASCLR